MPKEIVQKLNREVRRTLNDPEFSGKLKTMGIDPVGDTPDEFAAFLRQEVARWKVIVTEAGITLE